MDGYNQVLNLLGAKIDLSQEHVEAGTTAKIFKWTSMLLTSTL